MLLEQMVFHEQQDLWLNPPPQPASHDPSKDKSSTPQGYATPADMPPTDVPPPPPRTV